MAERLQAGGQNYIPDKINALIKDNDVIGALDLARRNESKYWQNPDYFIAYAKALFNANELVRTQNLKLSVFGKVIESENYLNSVDDLLKAAIQYSPYEHNSQAMTMLADIRFIQHRYDSATHLAYAATKSREDFPQKEWAFEILSQSHYNLAKKEGIDKKSAHQHLDCCVKSTTKGLEEFPDNPSLLYLRGRAALAMDASSNSENPSWQNIAYQALEKLFTVRPSHHGALKLHHIFSKQFGLDKAPDINYCRNYFTKSIMARVTPEKVSFGRLNSAITDGENGLHCYGNDHIFLCSVATAYLTRAKINEKPDNKQYDYARSEELFKLSLAISPADERTNNGYMECLAVQGKHDEIITFALQQIQQYPILQEEPQFSLSCAVALMEKASKEAQSEKDDLYRSAGTLLDKTIEGLPDGSIHKYPFIYIVRAEIGIYEEDYKNAIHLLEPFYLADKKGKSSKPRHLVDLSEAYAGNMEYEKALEVTQFGRTYFPDHFTFYDKEITLLRRLDLDQEADQVVREMHNKFPTNRYVQLMFNGVGEAEKNIPNTSSGSPEGAPCDYVISSFTTRVVGRGISQAMTPGF
jgi:hypothetical protein